MFIKHLFHARHCFGNLDLTMYNTKIQVFIKDIPLMADLKDDLETCLEKEYNDSRLKKSQEP